MTHGKKIESKSLKNIAVSPTGYLQADVQFEKSGVLRGEV